MQPRIPSVRVIPDDWIHPLPLPAWFPRRQPIEVDLGCGKGRFLLARAAKHPETNFLGIDRMLRRIRKIDNKARRLGLDNIRLLRVEGYYAVAYLMPPDSIQTYYIFFPDPWPKKRHHENRLFSPRFIDALYRTLVDGGAVHVATDHGDYFEQIFALLGGDPRFRRIEPFVPAPDEQTDFELWYASRTIIHRLSVQKLGGNLSNSASTQNPVRAS
ncbi:MAG: tRNA (guanosine(46)-N7)-methyltransferase TrmB [Kiritimatiellae bacterium]|nr:tRNA (guanosine(46)-N7)-methyltransferase TrmB [Kiritimatiellia bacterium]MDW8458646.1 tRNA (guanosine(46)-N7)-methyltransferase TrmB [Verrucomicrobiota bacterium]